MLFIGTYTKARRCLLLNKIHLTQSNFFILGTTYKQNLNTELKLRV